MPSRQPALSIAQGILGLLGWFCSFPSGTAFFLRKIESPTLTFTSFISLQSWTCSWAQKFLLNGGMPQRAKSALWNSPHRQGKGHCRTLKCVCNLECVCRSVGQVGTRPARPTSRPTHQEMGARTGRELPEAPQRRLC